MKGIWFTLKEIRKGDVRLYGKNCFLHFEIVLRGPISRNLRNLAAGIRQAAVQGAEWVLAPELAVQGYHFTVSGKPYTIREDIEVGAGAAFVCGSGERDIFVLGDGGSGSCKPFAANSCLVISPENHRAA